MNIFVTHFNPAKCAVVLDDKRVVKMVLESAQLLCTALWINSSYLAIPYKPTHVNHPCSIWVRSNGTNYLWLVSHFEALLVEYRTRYGKEHACQKHLDFFKRNYHLFPFDKPSEGYVNCTPYKDMGVYEAYKLTLIQKWTSDKRKPTWNKVKRTDFQTILS